MRSSAILLILLIIGSAFCALDRNQGTLLNKNIKDTLSKSDLGRAIIGMVEMGSQLSGSSLKGLYDALGRLKENILTSKENESLDFANDEETHNAEVDRLNGAIALYSSQITTFTDELANIALARQQLDSDLVNQKQQLSSAKSTVEQEEDFLKKSEASYNAEVNNYNQAIQLLDQAVAKLIEASGNADASNVNVVLAQTNLKVYENIAVMLQSSLNKIKSKVFIQPVSQLFMQLSKKDAQITTDQIQRAQQALTDLKAFYQSGLDELTTQFNAEQAKHQDLIKSLKVQIGALENQVIPKTEIDIEANKSAQEVKEGELSDAQSNKRESEKQLEAETESWGKRVEAHDLLMPEYDSEYAVVVQAEQLIRNAAPSAFIEIDE